MIPWRPGACRQASVNAWSSPRSTAGGRARRREAASRLLVRAAGSGDAEASVGVLIEKHRRFVAAQDHDMGHTNETRAVFGHFVRCVRFEPKLLPGAETSKRVSRSAGF